MSNCVDPYYFEQNDECIELKEDPAVERFKLSLLKKRAYLRKRIQNLEEHFADCAAPLQFEASKDIPGYGSARAVRTLLVNETLARFMCVMDAWTDYEEAVSPKNVSKLTEIVTYLEEDTLYWYNRVMNADKKNVWSKAWHKIFFKWPSIDRWLRKYHKKLMCSAAGTMVLGVVLLLVHFAPWIPLAGVAVYLPAAALMTSGAGMITWIQQRRNARRKDMARLTYQNINALKAAANDPDVLAQTFDKIKAACAAMYEHWQILPIDVQCGICYCDIDREDKLGRPKCGRRHTVVYHYACILKWNQTNKTCPTCRENDVDVEWFYFAPEK